MIVYEKLDEHEDIQIGDMITVSGNKATRSIQNAQIIQDIVGVCVYAENNVVGVERFGLHPTNIDGVEIYGAPYTLSWQPGKLILLQQMQKEVPGARPYGTLTNIIDENTAVILLNI